MSKINTQSLFVLIISCLLAVTTGYKSCIGSWDCPKGYTCVAGSAHDSIQRCVKGSVCGGPVAGLCPEGLLCTWVEKKNCKTNRSLSCKTYNGRGGIHQCLSVDRCDQLLGKQTCSNACSSHGKQKCNGKGTCATTGPSSFSCECSDGFSGENCSVDANGNTDHVSANHGSTGTNVDTDADSDNTTVDCSEDASICGSNGQCVNNECHCMNGFTGSKCQSPPSKNNSTDAGFDDAATEKEDGGIDKTLLLVIIISVVALALLGLFIIAAVSRRRRKQSVINRAAEENAAAAAEEPEEQGEGSGSPYGLAEEGQLTPKGEIAIF